MECCSRCPCSCLSCLGAPEPLPQTGLRSPLTLCSEPPSPAPGLSVHMQLTHLPPRFMHSGPNLGHVNLLLCTPGPSSSPELPSQVWYLWGPHLPLTRPPLLKFTSVGQGRVRGVLGATNPAGRCPRSLRSPLGSGHGEGPFSGSGGPEICLEPLTVLS